MCVTHDIFLSRAHAPRSSLLSSIQKWEENHRFEEVYSPLGILSFVPNIERDDGKVAPKF